MIDDLDMGEIAEAFQGLRRQPAFIEHDLGLDGIPIVIGRRMAAAAHGGDRLQSNHENALRVAALDKPHPARSYRRQSI